MWYQIISDKNVTFLSKHQYLFTGTTAFQFKFKQKTLDATENVAFSLVIPAQRTQGSFILEGYCKGNILGFNQNVNRWPPV